MHWGEVVRFEHITVKQRILQAFEIRCTTTWQCFKKAAWQQMATDDCDGTVKRSCWPGNGEKRAITRKTQEHSEYIEQLCHFLYQKGTFCDNIVVFKQL